VTIDIVIVDYDPGWPVAFEREAAALRAAFGSVAHRIDHVGSTAVPGLGAKPVIDIQVSVGALQPIDAYAQPLAACGYTFFEPPDGDLDDYPFFYKPTAWPHTHHVHVCASGSDREWVQLAFPAWLRAHADDRAAYEALKRDLARREWQHGDEYADAKTEFVARVIRDMRADPPLPLSGADS
jgi:GrpB-like predicted nucleotidyltransferase (UPF0157 family)